MKPLSRGGSAGRPVSTVNRSSLAGKQQPAADLPDYNFPTDEVANLHPAASKLQLLWLHVEPGPPVYVTGRAGPESRDPRWPL